MCLLYMSCCNPSKKAKTCKRVLDGKQFDLPRRFTQKQCAHAKGFTMRASCAPYKGCKLVGGANKSRKTEHSLKKRKKLRKKKNS